MKIVVMEPLGVAEGTLRQQAEELLGKDAALCLYDSPAKDAAELVERGADADVILPPTSGRTLACFGKVLLRGHCPLPALN